MESSSTRFEKVEGRTSSTVVATCYCPYLWSSLRCDWNSLIHLRRFFSSMNHPVNAFPLCRLFAVSSNRLSSLVSSATLHHVPRCQRQKRSSWRFSPVPFHGWCFSVGTRPSCVPFSLECACAALTVDWCFAKYVENGSGWFFDQQLLDLDHEIIDRSVGTTFEWKDRQSVDQRCSNGWTSDPRWTFHLGGSDGNHRDFIDTLVESWRDHSLGCRLHDLCTDGTNHLWQMYATDLVRMCWSEWTDPRRCSGGF